MRPRPLPAIAALGLTALAGAALWLLAQLAAVAAGFTAKLACSGVFVSGRPLAEVLEQDVRADHPGYVGALLRQVEVRLDRDGQTVRAAFPLLAEREAVHRPGLGCTLAMGTGAEALRRAVAPAPPLASAPPLPADPPRPALEAALDEAFAEPDPARPRRTRAVLVLHEGRIAAERYAPGFRADMPLAGWSVSKSVVNALAGALARQGRLDPERDRLLPQWSDGRARIRVRHLLAMESGLDFDENYANPLSDVILMLFGRGDAAGFAAMRPLRAAPGTRWAYASGNTNILARVLREASGLPPAEQPWLARRLLFAPLGMASAVFEPDATGTLVGSSFMFASARDWARFGQLYLDDGVHRGERLLPPGWVQAARTPAAGAPRGEFGAHFWLRLWGDGAGTLPPDAFHGLGHDGQMLSIVPSRRLVVVRLGLARLPGSWDHAAFLARIIAALDASRRPARGDAQVGAIAAKG